MLELRSSNASINIYDIILINIDPQLSPSKTQPLIPTNRISIRFSIFKEEDLNLIGMNLIPKYTQIGFSNLNFYKILTENDNIITKQSSRFFQTFRTGNEGNVANEEANPLIKFQIFDDITKQFSEEIFYQGNVIGKIEGTIHISKIPLIRQIMCGVHTERGFDISSIQVNFNDAKTGINSFKEDTSPPELRILSNQTNNLLSNLLKGTNLTQYTQSFREINLQILQIMNELKGVLQKSFKESALYYNYINNKDLFKAQKIMLELGISILKIIESLNLEQRAVGFEIIILINNRAEFDLGTVCQAWFIDQPQGAVFRDSTLINEKIIEKFILFDNMCLEFVLERISRGKSIDKESKVFVEFFLSVAYFRNPKFRKAFLDAISRDLYTDPKSYKEDDKTKLIEDFLNLDPINSLILWEVVFYKRLESALKGINKDQTDCEIFEKLKETDTIISKEVEWQDRLSKRGLAFYSMVSKLEKYVGYKVVKNMDIKWANIPGFDIILDAIAKELQIKEITTYSPQLIEVMALFINDSDIINNFARIIVHKTK